MTQCRWVANKKTSQTLKVFFAQRLINFSHDSSSSREDVSRCCLFVCPFIHFDDQMSLICSTIPSHSLQAYQHLSETAQLTIRPSTRWRSNVCLATTAAYRRYSCSNWLQRGAENWGKWSMLWCSHAFDDITGWRWTLFVDGSSVGTNKLEAKCFHLFMTFSTTNEFWEFFILYNWIRGK